MRYKSAKLLNNDGKMWHIGLDENDAGRHFILPGDPARCEMVARHFDEAKLVAVSRGNPTYTGRYHGADVSVMCTGMGAMAVAVAVEELNHLGVKTMIRMGTCGSFQPNLPENSFVIATGAVRGEGASKEYISEEFPAVADVDVVYSLRKACEEYGVKPYLGIVRSHDSFYMESPGAHEGYMDRIKPWQDAGVLCVENESSALFTVASLLGGIRAGTILLCGGYLGSSYGSMHTTNKDNYQEKVDLLSKITLRAIEMINELPDLEDIRKLND